MIARECPPAAADYTTVPDGLRRTIEWLEAHRVTRAEVIGADYYGVHIRLACARRLMPGMTLKFERGICFTELDGMRVAVSDDRDPVKTEVTL